MLERNESMREALAMQSEAVDGVEVAQAEQQFGGAAMSLGLLKDSIEKEREGLTLLEEGVETLRLSLDQRRQALDVEVELIDQIIQELEAGTR